MTKEERKLLQVTADMVLTLFCALHANIVTQKDQFEERTQYAKSSVLKLQRIISEDKRHKSQVRQSRAKRWKRPVKRRQTKKATAPADPGDG